MLSRHHEQCDRITSRGWGDTQHPSEIPGVFPCPFAQPGALGVAMEMLGQCFQSQEGPELLLSLTTQLKHPKNVIMPR